MIYVLKKKYHFPGTKKPLNTRNGTEQKYCRQVRFL